MPVAPEAAGDLSASELKMQRVRKSLIAKEKTVGGADAALAARMDLEAALERR